MELRWLWYVVVVRFGFNVTQLLHSKITKQSLCVLHSQIYAQASTETRFEDQTAPDLVAVLRSASLLVSLTKYVDPLDCVFIIEC